MSHEHSFVISPNTLNHGQKNQLAKPTISKRYANLLGTSYVDMLNHVGDSIQGDITVYDFPRGGTIGAQVIGDELTHFKYPHRIVTIPKEHQESIRNQVGDYLQYFSNPSQTVVVPESFVDKGRTLYGVVAQLIRFRKNEDLTVIVMTPTMRFEGVQVLRGLNQLLKDSKNGRLLAVSHQVLHISDNQVPEHGDVHEKIARAYPELIFSRRGKN